MKAIPISIVKSVFMTLFLCLALSFAGSTDAYAGPGDKCSARGQKPCPAIYPGEPCDAGLDEYRGKCQPCGGVNQRACRKLKRGYPCRGKTEPDRKNICRPCGGDGQKACRALKKGKQCNKGLFKDGNTCRACGGPNQKACPKIFRGYPCNGKYEPDSRGYCKPCGGENQKACRALKEGKQCNSGLTKDGGYCKPCGGNGQVSCPVAWRGPICKPGLGKINGKCRPCGKQGQAACPAMERGRQCEKGTTESGGTCKPCGKIGLIACKVTDRGKTCEEGKRKDGRCVADIMGKVKEKADDRLAEFVGKIAQLALVARNVDRDDVAKNRMRVAEANQRKPGGKGSSSRVTVSADDLPDNNACVGDEFQTWSVGVGAEGALFKGYSGEAGLAIRCADHTWGEKDSKWYASGALNSQVGGGASAGVTIGMWMDEFNRLSGDSHGYTVSIMSALDTLKGMAVSTALMDSLENVSKVQPELSIGLWFERPRDDEVGRFLGFTVTVSGAVGLDAGGMYSKASTVQFAD